MPMAFDPKLRSREVAHSVARPYISSTRPQDASLCDCLKKLRRLLLRVQ